MSRQKEHQKVRAIGTNGLICLFPAWLFYSSHYIFLNNTQILANISSYDVTVARESVEICLQADAINKEDRARLNDSSLPLLEILKEEAKTEAVPLRGESHLQYIGTRRMASIRAGCQAHGSASVELGKQIFSIKVFK